MQEPPSAWFGFFERLCGLLAVPLLIVSGLALALPMVAGVQWVEGGEGRAFLHAVAGTVAMWALSLTVLVAFAYGRWTVAMTLVCVASAAAICAVAMPYLVR